ncbi:MAG: hypothetical protein ABIZ09_10110, partial [Rhodoferax sp.]
MWRSNSCSPTAWRSETFPFPAGLTPTDTADQRTEAVEGGAVVPANLLKQNWALALVEYAHSAIDTVAIATAIAQTAKRLNDLREAWLT